jgi:hypothetical protein
MSIDPYAPPAQPDPAPAPAAAPVDLNDVFKRPAAANSPTGYPPIGAAIAKRARPVSMPQPWTDPSGDAYARSIYESDRRAARSKNITFGLILLVVGIVVTAATYDSASRQGGTYIIAWGPMVFGAIRLFKGLAS